MGTKSGEILVFDLASSALVQTTKAHEGAVWSLHVRSDNAAMVSGSADKDVKFWEFERKTEEGSKLVSANLLASLFLLTDYLKDWTCGHYRACQDFEDDGGCLVSSLQS